MYRREKNSCFNSTLVQLKVSGKRFCHGRSSSFQFYLSSIKSLSTIKNRLAEYKFQFYLSSIKSIKSTSATTQEQLFQFYLSSIKSGQR